MKEEQKNNSTQTTVTPLIDKILIKRGLPPSEIGNKTGGFVISPNKHKKPTK